MWTLQALVTHCDLILVTVLPIDLAELDRQYGTRLATSVLRVVTQLPALATRRLRVLLSRQLRALLA